MLNVLRAFVGVVPLAGLAWLVGIEPVTAQRSQVPIMSETLIVQPGQAARFLQDVNAFAVADGFAIRIGSTRPGGVGKIIQMWREDIKIIAVNAISDREYIFDFYQNCDFPVFKTDFAAASQHLLLGVQEVAQLK